MIELVSVAVIEAEAAAALRGNGYTLPLSSPQAWGCRTANRRHFIVWLIVLYSTGGNGLCDLIGEIGGFAKVIELPPFVPVITNFFLTSSLIVTDVVDVAFVVTLTEASASKGKAELAGLGDSRGASGIL